MTGLEPERHLLEICRLCVAHSFIGASSETDSFVKQLANVSGGGGSHLPTGDLGRVWLEFRALPQSICPDEPRI